MQKVLAAFVVVSLLVPAPSFAQQPESIQSSLMARFDGQTKKAIGESATREARSSVAKEDMQKAKSPTSAGKRITRGALIGAAAGFLLTAVSPECTQPGGYCSPYMFIGTAIGAGAGAAVGYFVAK